MPKAYTSYNKLVALEDERKKSLNGTKVNLVYLNVDCTFPGTLPEKLVFDYLMRLNIPFYFQYVKDPEWGSMGFPVDSYTIDFYIPSCNVAIEVQGEYWHSLPGAAQHDALKSVILEASGVRVVFWWETDIYSGLAELFYRDVPEVINFKRGAESAELYAGMMPFDVKAKLLTREKNLKAMLKRKIKPKVQPYKSHAFKLKRKMTIPL
jgi:hypothetical protein